MTAYSIYGNQRVVHPLRNTVFTLCSASRKTFHSHPSPLAPSSQPLLNISHKTTSHYHSWAKALYSSHLAAGKVGDLLLQMLIIKYLPCRWAPRPWKTPAGALTEVHKGPHTRIHLASCPFGGECPSVNSVLPESFVMEETYYSKF